MPDEEPVDLSKEAEEWCKTIAATVDINDLKETYGNAYKALSKDKSAVESISTAKDAQKAKLGA